MCDVSITVTSQLTPRRLKSPASRLCAQPFVQAQIKENIKAPRHWPLPEDRGIPIAKGHWHGKRFHLMTSSWSYQYQKSHCEHKTILRSSYLHNVISYTGEITSICWIKPQNQHVSLYMLRNIMYDTSILSFRVWGSYSNPADPLRINDVIITPKRCYCDVITSKWRRFDVLTTLLLCLVFSGKWTSEVSRDSLGSCR